MDLNELPGGIPSRISGLVFSLLRHFLALSELAAEETRLLIRQSVAAILLFIALILTLVISYLALIATVIALLTLREGWGWAESFASVGLFHLLLAGLLVFFIRNRTAPRPYEATSAEIRRDLDALGNYSEKSSRSVS